MDYHGALPKDSVAITGMAFQLPAGIDQCDKFWKFCKESRCAATPIPKHRFDADGFYHPDQSKAGYFHVHGGSFLEEDVASFDAPFFNISEPEARCMDPQQRLLLECTFQALTNAGMSIESIAGRQDVGVFAGGSGSEYAQSLSWDPYRTSRYAATGGAMSMFANRVSYFFGLRGPSQTIDTACSSSLVALHLAVESIRRGECSCAIVGGSFLQLSPAILTYMSSLGAVGAQGKSFSFDHRADGYGRGEGVVCIVLKSPESAHASRDSVRAVIRNCGVNHSGHSAGLTAPNATGQAELIARVYQSAGLDPYETDFVEGHGTGTKLGDPIEVESVARVFTGSRCKSRPLYLGSAKSNFGHLEAASGLLSVIKCVLMLERGMLLPNANFEKNNPQTNLGQLGLKVPTQCLSWPNGHVRRASINNFGFGGANAHVILEEAPEAAPSSPSSKSDPDAKEPWRLYVFSAKDEKCLRQYIANLKEYLGTTGHDEPRFMAGLSYTACCRRSIFSYRVSATASTRDELVQKLSNIPSIGRLSVAPRLQFVFSGQGAQWPQMGLSLFQYSKFAQTMSEAQSCLNEFGAEWSLIDEIANPPTESSIGEANISQPTSTALQVALVSLLDSWDIRPSRVCGHSSGEIAAAYAAGILDLRSCMAVAYYRGKRAKELREFQEVSGAMMAIGGSADAVDPLLRSLMEGIAMIACYNSPDSVTVSGDYSALCELKPMLDELGLFNRFLKVDVAYHTDHMRPVSSIYLQDIEPVLEKNSSTTSKDIEFFSSVNGMLITPKMVRSPWYWVANLLCPVQFSTALSKMTAITPNDDNGKARTTLLELGPHSTLRGPIQQTVNQSLSEKDAQSTTYLHCLQRGHGAGKTILGMVASLINDGYPVDWRSVSQKFSGSKLLTDVPPYCFNKSRRYWQNCRAMEEYAHSTLPWNELLGHNVTGTTGRTSVFRNVFTLEDLPWLRDHKLRGTVIFPMAGYIAMAVEAVLVVSNLASDDIEGFHLREMSLNEAWPIAEDVTYDSHTVLQHQPHATRVSSSSGWFNFKILSWTEASGFSEHCRGLIAVSSKASDQTFDHEYVRSLRSYWDENLKNRASSSIVREVPGDYIYRKAAAQGLEYGPSFRLLSRLRTGADHAIGSVVCGEVSGLMPVQHRRRLAIHPSILDAAFHAAACNVAGNKGDPEQVRAVMPTFVPEMYISNSLDQEAGREIHAYFHDANTDSMSRTSTGSITCFQGGRSQSVIEVRNIKMFPIDEAENEAPPGDALNPMTVQWRKEPSLLPPRWIEQFVSSEPPESSEYKHLQDLEQACYYLIEAAVSTPRSSPAKVYLYKLQEWMERTVDQAKLAAPDSIEAQWLKLDQSERQRFIEKVCPRSLSGELIAAVGSRLGDIFEGTADPLSLMLQEGRLWRVYDESVLCQRSYKHLAEIMGLLSLQNPSMRVLEVGAGTGSCTARVLEELSSIPSLGTRFGTYDYTDIPPGFFEAAANKFKRFKSRLNLKRFDLSQDPGQQGFAAGSYDVVIAADVIHATPDIAQSLRHLRQVLRPNGVLLMVELSSSNPLMLPFATLPGWWSHEGGPILPRSEWHDLLIQSGFTGLDEAISDFADVDVNATFMSRVSHRSPALRNSVAISSDMAPPEVLMTGLDGLVTRSGGHFVGHRDISASGQRDSVYICLDELQKPLLTNACRDRFYQLHRLFGTARGVLWVTRTPRMDSPEEPMLDAVFGFARTLRRENAGIKFVILQVQDTEDSQVSANILSVFEHVFIRNADWAEVDTEYKVTDGLIHVPRIVPDNAMGSLIERQTTDNPVEGQKLWQSGRLHQATMGSVGLLSTIYWQQHDLVGIEQSLSSDEVLVEIKAAGLNFKDVLLALGSVPWEPLGKECSGVVIATGPAASAQFAKGDSVIAWGEGLLATHARCKIQNVIKMPESLSYTEAASVFVVYGTAYESLINVAHLKRGEKVLIHAAAGGVGQAAIRVAQWIGADIYCTVGTLDKRSFLGDVYGIPESHVFSSRSLDFAKGLLLATDMYGVDVVLNSLAGESLQRSWFCLAPFARFVDIGKRSALENEYLEMAPFEKAVSFHAVDLSLLIQHRGKHFHHVMGQVMSHISSGTFCPPVPIQSVRAGDTESAIRTMQAGRHTGKMVLVFDDCAELVKARPTPGARNPIRPDASYIITGGTGGIGQSIAKWLLDKGANHVVLAARRGQDGVPEADIQQLVGAASANNAHLQIAQCDIGSSADVQRLVQGISRDRPIRGVIHGAMTLRDALFEKTSYDDWRAVLHPRISGVINLHEVVQHEPLDFFICLSSAVAITGNAGQTSYAAGSAVLDSFCRWGRLRGLPTISVNLPTVSDVGYVAKTREQKQKGSVTYDMGCSISEAEVRLFMQAAVSARDMLPPDGESAITDHGQTMIGISVSPNLASQAWAQPSLFSHYRRLCSDSSSAAGGHRDESAQGQSLKDILGAHMEFDEAFNVIFEAVAGRIAGIMMKSEDISPDDRIVDLGLDSLIAVELRNWIVKQVDVNLTVIDIVNSGTVAQLVRVIIEKSNLVQVS